CPQETGPRSIDARLAKSSVALYALPMLLDTHALSSTTRAAAHACPSGPHRTANWGMRGGPGVACASSVPSDLPWRGVSQDPKTSATAGQRRCDEAWALRAAYPCLCVTGI